MIDSVITSLRATAIPATETPAASAPPVLLWVGVGVLVVAAVVALVIVLRRKGK
jgi:hypothetical protein